MKKIKIFGISQEESANKFLAQYSNSKVYLQGNNIVIVYFPFKLEKPLYSFKTPQRDMEIYISNGNDFKKEYLPLTGVDIFKNFAILYNYLGVFYLNHKNEIYCDINLKSKHFEEQCKIVIEHRDEHVRNIEDTSISTFIDLECLTGLYSPFYETDYYTFKLSTLYLYCKTLNFKEYKNDIYYVEELGKIIHTSNINLDL